MPKTKQIPKPKRERKKTPAELSIIPVQKYPGLAADRQECMDCGRFDGTRFCLRPFVPQGYTKKFLFVFDVPGLEGFPGQRMDIILRCLRRSGYSALDAAFTAATLCGTMEKPTMTQIRFCRPLLLRAIELLSPEFVVFLGVTALHSALNKGEGDIAKTRGRVLEAPGISARCAVTFDPQGILAGRTWMETEITNDLKQIDSPRLEWPKRDPGYGPVNLVGFDTEYTPEGEVITVGYDSAIGSDAYDPRDRSMMLKGVMSNAESICAHSVGADFDYLVRHGLAKKEWYRGINVYDSLVLARMHNENLGKGSYRLKNLVQSRHRVAPWEAGTENSNDPRDWQRDRREDRCRLDAWASRKLVEDLLPLLPKNLVTFTNMIALTLHRIWLAGMAIDQKTFERLGNGWAQETEKLGALLKSSCAALGLTDFEPTNDNHVRGLLYDTLRLKVRNRTEIDNLPAVDKGAIRKLLREECQDDPSRVELLERLLAFSKVDKLATTWYGKEGSKALSLRDLIKEGPEGLGWLQNRIKSVGARTGRRSGGKDDDAGDRFEARNPQNWPQAAREIVVSRWKGGKIGAFDYKRLEVVLMGWAAQDEKLLHYFTEGTGYIGVAKELFNIDCQEGDQAYKVMKSIVLGVDYNMKKWKLARDIHEKAGKLFDPDWKKHVDYCDRLREKYLRVVFPGVGRYVDSRLTELSNTQQIVTRSGRVRHLPHHGPSTPKYWHFENVAVNFGIQSFASDVTGSAMIDVERTLLKHHGLSYQDYHRMLIENPFDPDLPSLLINEVHDELDFDMNPLTEKGDREIIIETMRGVPTLRRLVSDFRVPLGVDDQIGPTWQERKEA